MFIRHARILLNLRLWMAQGVRNPQELAPKLGVHPFFVRRYIDQAARWPTNKLIQLVELLAQSEKNIKGGRSLPEAVLIEDCLMGVLALGRDRLSVRSQPQPHR
jgi:DNA polymerase III delta subunit